MTQRSGSTSVLVGLAAGLLIPAAMGAQGQATDTPRQQPPRVLSDSLAGRDSFQLYCAPCHGPDARGNGPVAPALKTAPPDLTQLSRRNGGTFPADRVRAYVTGTGRTLPSHGPAEMPVWGPTFRAFEADVRVQERIKNLVEYLAKQQQPSSAPGERRREAVLGQLRLVPRHDGHRQRAAGGPSPAAPARPDALHVAQRRGVSQ